MANQLKRALALEIVFPATFAPTATISITTASPPLRHTSFFESFALYLNILRRLHLHRAAAT